MRKMVAVALGVMLSGATVRALAQGDAPAAAERDVWGQLVAANDLDLKGKTPFDLAMTFQLYGLNGKAEKTGSVEEWWAAPGSRKVEVHLEGLDEDGRAPEGADAALVRDAYLVNQLLEDAVAPVPAKAWITQRLQTKDGALVVDRTAEKSQAAGALITKRVKVGKVALDCMAPATGSGMSATLSTLCVPPQTNDVLVLQGLDGKESLLRPRTGTFQNTHVGLELRLSYLGEDAITGRLMTMRIWEPPATAAKVPVAATTVAHVTQLSGGVIAGNRISFVEPQYPEMARAEHAGGSVLLSAVIGKDGKISRLVPIASTAPMFTESAMQAVRGWTYRPYLLNGEPTEVDTTITVNFAIGQR